MVLPKYCCCSSEFRPSGHGKLQNLVEVRQLWLILYTENIFCGRIYDWFCWLSHVLLRQNRTTKPTQQGELREKKFALAVRQRARNSLIFRCGCKQETLGCKRLKIKRRINFATRPILLRPSHANFDFLFSNFAVRDFILFTLDFNTQPEMRINRIKFVLMRSAFCRGVAELSSR